MQRQAIIYSVYAGLGLAMFAYMLSRCAIAWEHFGLSDTFFLVAVIAALFAALTIFYSWIAFLFKSRAVVAVHRTPSGVLLVPAKGSFSTPVAATQVRIIKRFGKQFSRDESVPKFTLFQAANRYWVTSTPIEANTPVVPSEA